MRFDCCLRIFGSRANTGLKDGKVKGGLGRGEEQRGIQGKGGWAWWVVQRQAIKQRERGRHFPEKEKNKKVREVGGGARDNELLESRQTWSRHSA